LEWHASALCFHPLVLTITQIASVMKNIPHTLKTIAFLLLAGTCLPVQSKIFNALGVFPGGASTSEYIPNYADFEELMGQDGFFTDAFVDTTASIEIWPNSAGFGARNVAEKNVALGANLIPIVTVGLTDNPHAYVGGAYSEANAIAMMNDIAAGVYDDKFLGVINAYKNQGFTQIYLRIAHEQNGAWYGWKTSTPASASAYVAAWRRVANLAHNQIPGFPVTGITVKTVWSPIFTLWNPVPVESSYPGDAYVDVFGPDFYASVWPATLMNWENGGMDPDGTTWALNDTNRQHYWDYPHAGPSDHTDTDDGLGMVAALAFAKAHNKPFGLSECGSGTAGGARGPIDDSLYPYYLANRLAAAMEDGVQIEFVTVWDAMQWKFSGGVKPAQAAAFHQFTGTMAAATAIPVPFGVNYSIGTSATGGGTGSLPGQITLQGGGLGYKPASASDNLNFVALPLSGDGSFVMQIVSSPTVSGGQVGVMLRGGMREDDPYAAVYLSGSTCTFISRAVAGEEAVQNAQVAAGAYPLWLKIERQGAALLSYKSTDGKTWAFIGSRVMSISKQAYVGAAISSSSVSLVNTATLNYVNSPNDVILDSVTATKTGTWLTKTAPSGFGGSYLTDNNANKATPCTVTYTPNLPAAGTYDIYAYYQPAASAASAARASNVPVTITNSSGSNTLVLDQTKGRMNYWNYVGTASMLGGTANTVKISNAGTSGWVIADGLKFVLNPAPVGAKTGSVSPVPPLVNLAEPKVADWSHWGGVNGAPANVWDHALTSISNYVKIGAGSIANSSSGSSYSWTGSVGPNTATTSSSRCVYSGTVGTGYQFTVTTGSSPQLLDVYVGHGYVGAGQLQVLNSSSAVVYTGTSSVASSVRVSRNYTVSLSDPGTYTVRWVQTGAGNISLEGAVLRNQQ
jgi:hypothetical protein